MAFSRHGEVRTWGNKERRCCPFTPVTCDVHSPYFAIEKGTNEAITEMGMGTFYYNVGHESSSLSVRP